jgi:hypothetical protein
MPDINSPKANMAKENSSTLLGTKDQTMWRRWSCPGDLTIAAYADGALGDCRKAWIGRHLASCQRCRHLVAETVKAQRDTELLGPPEELRWKALELVGRRPASPRWVWVPAGALAAVAVLVVAIVVLRKPEQLIMPSLPSSAAPMIAKSEPAGAARTPVSDIERKPTSAELLPSVIVPHADSIVRRERLEFGWKPVPHSRYYEIRIVTSDGDLVWSGQTEKSKLRPPTDVAVQGGSYFVWITAYLEDGRVAKSPPVKFGVQR